MQIVVGMATMRGRELHVKKAVKSLEMNRRKPDKIFLYDNAVREDLTDNGKFWGLTQVTEPVYYLSCDDDLIYPNDYVATCINGIEKYNSIVTFHGRQLLGAGKNYYHGHNNFPFSKNVPMSIEIDVPGTGVTAFRTDYFNPVGLHLAEDKKMADLVFAVEASKQEKTITHLKHRAGWVRAQSIPIEKTIYGMEHRNCDRQSELADLVWKYKFGGGA